MTRRLPQVAGGLLCAGTGGRVWIGTVAWFQLEQVALLSGIRKQGHTKGVIPKITRQLRVVLLALEVVNPVGLHVPIRPQQFFEARIAQVNFNVFSIVFDGGISAVMLNADELLKPRFIMLLLTCALVAPNCVGERDRFYIFDFQTAEGV